MKLYVLSDLHLEFAPFAVDAKAAAECDVVVLAGDIDLGVRGIEWARETFGAKPVVYVCGNHEFYRHHWTELLGELRATARRCNIHFLEEGSAEIGGTRFLGCALWTDFEFFRKRPVTGVMRARERGMNDFHEIRAPSISRSSVGAPVGSQETSLKRLTAMHVRLRHRKSLTWLREQLNASNAAGIRPVVVTHHLPTARCVAARYARDDLTASFASHLDDLIPQARLWIHGHTHDSIDFGVDAEGQLTRVICNPRGYPLSTRNPVNFENQDFQPGLILEI